MSETYLTARKFGEKVELAHLEVIRRIKKGDIIAKKWGWNWAIPVTEVERVREEEWYKRLMARRGRIAS